MISSGWFSPSVAVAMIIEKVHGDTSLHHLLSRLPKHETLHAPLYHGP